VRAAALVAFLVVAGVAEARRCPECDCIRYISVLEPRDEPRDVAENAVVRVTRQPELRGQPAPRHALLGPDGEEVAVDERRLRIEGFAALELVPRGGLAPDTAYRAVVVRGERVLELETFRTGRGRDTTPPAWVGIRAARHVPPTSCSLACNDRRDASIEVVTDPPADDRAGAELLAVWMAKGGGAIDYKRPPLGHVRAERRPAGGIAFGTRSDEIVLTLGGDGPCRTPSVEIPRGARRVRVGMRPIDLAGNAGAVSEAVVAIPRTR
jgi:hypothetical protein